MTQIKDSRIQWHHIMDNLSAWHIGSEAVTLIYLDSPHNSGKQCSPCIEGNHCILTSFKDAWELFDINIGEEETLATANYTRVNSVALTIGG